MPTSEPQPAPFAVNHDASRSLRSPSSERERTVPKNSTAGCDGFARNEALRSSGMLSAMGPAVSSELRCFGRDWRPLEIVRFSVADKGPLPDYSQKLDLPRKIRILRIKGDCLCLSLVFVIS